MHLSKNVLPMEAACNRERRVNVLFRRSNGASAIGLYIGIIYIQLIIKIIKQFGSRFRFAPINTSDFNRLIESFSRSFASIRNYQFQSHVKSFIWITCKFRVCK